MTTGPTVTVTVCPACGARNVGETELCNSCGVPLDVAASGQRMTIPSSAHPPAELRASDRPPPHEMVDVSDSIPPAGPDPLVGLVVAGRYRILECIGRGGMGVVYKVEHTEIGKLLALKLLAGELSRDREIVRRFKREALLASRLSHPNSVQVFDFGASEGLTYLVMELVSGVDLSRILKSDGPLPWERLAKIVIQICSSLAEAHAKGIVHRDVKPENIIIAHTAEGSDLAKVLDFGLAKLREAPELNEVTSSGTVVGTPYYMAPEQICGKSVDGRTDIYSLGAVMYRMLTGEMVFAGASPMAVFTGHLTEIPVAPHLRAPARGVPESVSGIVMRALEKDADKRYQRIEELQAAVIEQLGDLSQSGIETLLNSARLEALQADAARVSVVLGARPGRAGATRGQARVEIATRDEVEAFQRKLARQRAVLPALAAAIACAAVYAGWHVYTRTTAKPGFQGLETEPNNQASEANDVPFGKPVMGQLGKRIDAERSDRDFFRIAVPTGAPAISIEQKAIFNMPTCLWVYRSGEVEPLARLCTGRAGLDLSVPAFRLDVGMYLFAIMQDREPHAGGAKPFVLENISDFYQLLVTTSSTQRGWEVEPNDAAVAATTVTAGAEVRGRFGWVDDIDVVCLGQSATGQRVQWVVTDADERPRDRGAVLQLTPSGGPRAGIAVRVHRAQAGGTKATTEDVFAPWKSEPFEAGGAAVARCVTLRLTSDPWAGSSAPLTPPVSSEQWLVRAEAVP